VLINKILTSFQKIEYFSSFFLFLFFEKSINPTIFQSVSIFDEQCKEIKKKS